MLTLLTACLSPFGYKYNSGTLPDKPTNLAAVNSAYDDYNSTAPTLGETFPLCFSSNRGSEGGQYDIVYKLVSITFDKDDGTLEVTEETNGNLDVTIVNRQIKNGLNKTKTDANEFGPYLIPLGHKQEENVNWNGYYEMYVLVYSNDQNGNHDFYFTENTESSAYTEPKPISFLNSEHNDAYFTLNEEQSSIYFTSDRDGSFDIYETQKDKDRDLITVLSEDNDGVSINKVEILSSAYDDKCPFILGNRMVFASNRPGGEGGYDLYYSDQINGEWTEPSNFGSEINTEYDEYRPIVRYQESFNSDFMLFSSNRPDGLGGFDLYYVGIDKTD
ncbi:TolB family protein [Marinoscillum sp.]|uniref:TolB family protein n=1 Tax=Marinoscillum sp. TaxID=2024838 RepID=UPI003BAC493C